MSIKEIFKILITTGETQPLLDLIIEVKNSIPPKQRIGKGIVWTLRQIRKNVKAEVPLAIQKKSLNILINDKHWEIRKFTAFIAVNCSTEEKDLTYYMSIIKDAAEDDHFGVRESAQMAMRELLQVFPKQIFRYYDKWVVDHNENVRRCVSESLRPVLVSGKNWIRDKPDITIQILAKLNCDKSLYVRKSVGNNLADISRRHPKLVLKTLHEWLTANNYNKHTLFIARKACRHLVKTESMKVKQLLKGASILK
jgi:3-methyladenine DNA glycosylase AlkC